MTSVKDWQLKWNVSDLALADLHQAMVLEASPDTINPKTPEQITQAEVRVEAANKGLVLWRNNVGWHSMTAATPSDSDWRMTLPR